MSADDKGNKSQFRKQKGDLPASYQILEIDQANQIIEREIERLSDLESLDSELNEEFEAQLRSDIYSRNARNLEKAYEKISKEEETVLLNQIEVNGEGQYGRCQILIEKEQESDSYSVRKVECMSNGKENINESNKDV